MGQQFVTAGRGLQKVLLGEILAVATTVLNDVFRLLRVESLLYLGSIVSMAGFVLILLGLSGAAMAHPGYRVANLCVWANVGIGVAVCFPFFQGGLYNVLMVLNLAVTLVGVYFVCKATAALHAEREEPALARQGALAWKVYVGCVAASLAANLASGGFHGTLTAVLLSGGALALRLAAETGYLLFLGASQKSLQNR